MMMIKITALKQSTTVNFSCLKMSIWTSFSVFQISIFHEKFTHFIEALISKSKSTAVTWRILGKEESSPWQSTPAHARGRKFCWLWCSLVLGQHPQAEDDSSQKRLTSPLRQLTHKPRGLATGCRCGGSGEVSPPACHPGQALGKFWCKQGLSCNFYISDGNKCGDADHAGLCHLCVFYF